MLAELAETVARLRKLPLRAPVASSTSAVRPPISGAEGLRSAAHVWMDLLWMARSAAQTLGTNAAAVDRGLWLHGARLFQAYARTRELCRDTGRARRSGAGADELGDDLG